MMTPADRRRFPVLLVTTLALLVILGTLFLPDQAQAQESSAPDKPKGLSATATHDQVVLTWDDPQDESITGYVILRRIPGVDPQGQFSELVSDTGTDATTYTDDIVSAETRYTYRIKAINEHGASERSRWYHINVPAAPGGPGKRANVSEGNDDCPEDATTPCEVDVGGSVTGNIGTDVDEDRFAVELEAGTRYQIDLEGQATGRGTQPNPFLDLLSNTSVPIELDDDDGVGDNARLVYTPTAAGTYYIDAGTGDDAQGTYTLSVIVLGANGASEADADFPETTATTGRVEVGASATGNLSTVTDVDWFKVVLEAGKTYQIDMKGLDGGGGTIGDPYLHDIRDSSGNGISNTGNDDVDADNDIYDSQITYTPTTAGAYYLVAAGASDSGTYTLSVRDLTPALSTDATLSALSVTGGGAELVTNFASDTYAYDASAANGVGQVTVTLEKSDSDATVEYLGSSDADSTADGHQVTLVVGNTVIKVKVTAEDGTTTQTYTVTVTLAEGSLVSNIGQGSTETHLTTTARSQRFRAGSNEAGYILTGVDVVSGGTHSFTAKVCGVASNNNPTSTCTDLTPPGSFAAGTMSFSPPPNITLSKGTTYAVVLTPVGSFMNYGRTTSEREDKGKQPGSSIANELEYLTFQTNTWTENNVFSVRIAIKGTLAGGDTPPACTLNDGDLWCGVVDVKAITNSGGSTVGHGFSGTTGDIDGNPEDKDFTVPSNSNEYTITSLVVGAGNTSGSLVLRLDEDLMDTATTDDQASLELGIDGESDPFLLSAATPVGSGGYRWDGTGLDWSSETPVTVRLREEAQPTLSVADAAGDEGDDEVEFTVTLSKPYYAATSATWTASIGTGDTAVAADLGTTKTGTVTIAAQATTAMFEVPVVDDTADEGDETFTVTLSAPTPPDVVKLATDATAKGTILDDDDCPDDTTTTCEVDVGGSATGNIGSAGDYDWFAVDLEAGKRYQFKLEGSPNGQGTLPDPYLSLYDGSDNLIWNVDDIDPTNFNSERVHDVTVTGTYYLEARGATIADTGTYTLSVSDITPAALPTLSIADAEGDEDDGVEFTATLTAGVSGKVTATWTATIESGDTASAADLATTTGEVEFDENATTANFTVPLNDDTTDEPDQTFTLTLSGVSSNAQLAADPTAEGTIDDDDPAPTLTVADKRHDEGDSERRATVTVSLSEVSEKRVRFKLRQVDRTGDTASDADWSALYSNPPFNAINAGGMSLNRFGGVVIQNDTLDEDDETLTVEAYSLENAQGSSSDREATITIVDNDPTPTVTVAAASATEGDKVEFVVTLSAVSGRDVEVGYATSVATGDTAVSGTDFEAATGTLTILAADSTATGTVEVQTTDDDATESAETFTLTLSATKNVMLGTASTAAGTIEDDDAAAGPTVTDVAVTSTPVLETDTYGAGEEILFTVTFSEAVDVTGDPEFAFSLDSGEDRAPYKSGSGTTALVFAYTVAPGDEDGIFLLDGSDFNNRDGAVTLDSDDAIKAAGSTTDADLAHTGGRGTQSGHKVDGSRSIVSVEVTSTPMLETDTYGAGETIRFRVTFNVAVDGDPVFTFALDGGESRSAAHETGGGTTALVFGYTVVSGDTDANGIFLWDEQDFDNPDGPVRLDSDDEIEFKDTSTDVPLYWSGRGTQSGHKVDGSRTTGNTAPYFTSSATFDAAENQTAAGTVVAADDDTDDSVTGYEITGGADQALFEIGATTGELTFKSPPNYEDPQDSGTDNGYEVTVQATSGTGTREMTADQTITVTVTNVNEKSAKPDKPVLAAVSGSTTSLTATWTKPGLNGGPDITGYALQYKESTESSWEDFAHTGTAVTTTITGLTADTSYQARVLAKNGETDSDWSDASDAVSTNAGTALPTLSIADAEGDEDDGV